MNTKTQAGFSLIELMVALGIIGLLAAIGMPMYQDYVAAARVSVMQDNMRSIHMFQQERRSSFGEYIEGEYVPGGTNTITSRLEWAPNSAADKISYSITCETSASDGECTRSSGYTITASHADDPGETVSMTY